MKILCVTLNHTNVWGGTTTTVADFTRALDADILSFTSESLIHAARHGKGIHHIPVPDSFLARKYLRPQADQLRLATEFARGYDLLICHMLFRYHNDWVTRMGKPYYIVPHGALDSWVFTYRRLQKELWLRLVGKRYFRGAEAVIFATRREQQKAFRGMGSDKARIISWAATEVPDQGPSRVDVREQLGIRENEKMLLSIGRLHSMKRPLETIEAFAQAAEGDMHLVIVGPEEEYSLSELQAAAKRFGARNVHVMGPVFGNTKWGIYRAADAYISLSERENFSHTLAEAMYAGLPAILSPGNDLAHDVVGEECFWLMETNTNEEAVRKIKAFARSDQEDRRQMGERGKRWIMTNAAFDRFRSRLSDLMLTHKPNG
jgi:glycosyltransferase involved in cell wall biosynthesis